MDHVGVRLPGRWKIVPFAFRKAILWKTWRFTYDSNGRPQTHDASHSRRKDTDARAHSAGRPGFRVIEASEAEPFTGHTAISLSTAWTNGFAEVVSTIVKDYVARDLAIDPGDVRPLGATLEATPPELPGITAGWRYLVLDLAREAYPAETTEAFKTAISAFLVEAFCTTTEAGGGNLG